jgi:hypothetical protein
VKVKEGKESEGGEGVMEIEGREGASRVKDKKGEE